jgi:uncharacterized damage-inducible protein DinB
MVALHATYLREFLDTWRRFDARGIALPATRNPNYASREALLAHVLGAAARYLTWMCEQLALPRPAVEEYPEASGFADRAEEYMESVLAAWEGPLRGVTEEQADNQAFVSRWGIPYSIDAMLEHAVMHPIRHAYQLDKLLRDHDA